MTGQLQFGKEQLWYFTFSALSLPFRRNKTYKVGFGVGMCPCTILVRK